jgi:PAS domain-containing protein
MAEFLEGIEARYDDPDCNVLDLFKHAPFSIAIIEGRELRFTYINEFADKIYGPRGLLGKSVRDAFPDLDENYFRLLAGVLDSGLSFRAKEYPITLDWNLDGSPFTRYLDFEYFPYRNRSNLVIGVISMAQDVTKEVAARNKIVELETILDIISRACPVSIGISDKNNQIFFTTNAWLNWTGTYLEDNKGNDWKDFILKEDLEPFLNQFLSDSAAKRSFQAKFRFRSVDGTIRTAFMKADPWYYPNGEYGGYVSNTMDIG